MENYDKKVMLKPIELEDDVACLKIVNQKNKLSAGNGITIQNNQISADTATLATKAELAQKQNTLTAGQNITIENNVISASGGQIDTSNLQPKLTAGTNITIENNVISVNISGVGGEQSNNNQSQNTIDYNLVNSEFVEYSLDKHKVLQCYADHDSKPCEEIQDYVYKTWLPYANRKIRQIAI